MHLFRVITEYADIYIKKIDLDNLEIEYRMYDPQGKPIEPWMKDKMYINGPNLRFGQAGRDLNIQLATFINLILHGDPALQNS